jgi:outer membrane protein
MRRILVSSLIAATGSLGLGSPVFAQSQAAAPAPAPSAAPAAAAAPAPDAADAKFELSAALRSSGTPLTADEAAKRAASTAPAVGKAELAARKAELAASQANLGVYPRVELEARYTRLSEGESMILNLPAALGGPTALPTPLLNQGLFQARVLYPVSTLFFSVMPRHKAGKLAAEAQKYQRKVELQTVSLAAREAYYEYARARAGLMVARSTLAQAEAHRKDVDALVAAGTLARVELVRSDAVVAQRRVTVLQTESSVAVARAMLFSLMHEQGTQDISVTENLEEPLPALTETQDAMLAKARGQRSELKALRTMGESHEHAIDGFEGDGLPQFNIGGSVDLANPNQRYASDRDEWNTSWAAFASITWSPNDLASSGNNENQQRAELSQVLLDLQMLEDGLRVEVAQAYEAYQAARAAMEASKAGIAAAEESFRVRREQFRAGAAVATEVIDAENDVQVARLNLVNAAIDGRIAKARLDRAIEAE